MFHIFQSNFYVLSDFWFAIPLFVCDVFMLLDYLIRKYGKILIKTETMKHKFCVSKTKPNPWRFWKLLENVVLFTLSIIVSCNASGLRFHCEYYWCHTNPTNKLNAWINKFYTLLIVYPHQQQQLLIEYCSVFQNYFKTFNLVSE